MPKHISTANIGLTAVQSIFEGSNWIFRRQPEDDKGVDAHVEVVRDSNATGLLVGLQIKSGPSYFNNVQNGDVVFYMSADHAQYWMNHSLLVLLVLHNPEDGSTVWREVTESTVVETSRGYRIGIPLDNALDDPGLRLIETLLRGNPRLALLELAEPIIRLASDPEAVILKAEEWVNKTLRTRDIRFEIVATGEVVEFPIMYPGPLGDALERYFPWARFETDDIYYETYGDAESLFGFYSMDDEFRPYEVIGSEVAHFWLIVTLSDVGKAYLTVQDFLEGA